MKRLLILGILLFSICIAYGQSTEKSKITYTIDNFVTIRINTGYTVFGTESIVLQREGLIYWRNPFLADHLPEEERKAKAKFIPFEDLDMEKVYKIIKYVHEQKLYEIDYDLSIPEYWHPTSRPTVLTFIVHEKSLYNGFNYYYCDQKIDAFIQMMNELIPEEDREKYGIIHRMRGCTANPAEKSKKRIQ